MTTASTGSFFIMAFPGWPQARAPRAAATGPRVVTPRFFRHPNLVAFGRLFLELDAELILFDAPFTGPLAAHGVARHRAVVCVEFAPVHFVSQFHAGELGSNLPCGKLLQLLLGLRGAAEHCGGEDRT